MEDKIQFSAKLKSYISRVLQEFKLHQISFISTLFMAILLKSTSKKLTHFKHFNTINMN